MLSWVTYALSPRVLPTVTAGAHLGGRASRSVRMPGYRAARAPTGGRATPRPVRRDPPVEVIVFRPLDAEQWPGLLQGWANDVADDRTLRALATYRREYAPGFWIHVVAWPRADHLRRR